MAKTVKLLVISLSCLVVSALSCKPRNVAKTKQKAMDGESKDALLLEVKGKDVSVSICSEIDVMGECIAAEFEGVNDIKSRSIPLKFYLDTVRASILPNRGEKTLKSDDCAGEKILSAECRYEFLSCICKPVKKRGPSCPKPKGNEKFPECSKEFNQEYLLLGDLNQITSELTAEFKKFATKLSSDGSREVSLATTHFLLYQKRYFLIKPFLGDSLDLLAASIKSRVFQVPSPSNWPAANSFCQDKGGRLATVNEYALIANKTSEVLRRVNANELWAFEQLSRNIAVVDNNDAIAAGFHATAYRKSDGQVTFENFHSQNNGALCIRKDADGRHTELGMKSHSSALTVYINKIKRESEIFSSASQDRTDPAQRVENSQQAAVGELNVEAGPRFWCSYVQNHTNAFRAYSAISPQPEDAKDVAEKYCQENRMVYRMFGYTTSYFPVECAPRNGGACVQLF